MVVVVSNTAGPANEALGISYIWKFVAAGVIAVVPLANTALIANVALEVLAEETVAMNTMPGVEVVTGETNTASPIWPGIATTVVVVIGVDVPTEGNVSNPVVDAFDPASGARKLERSVATSFCQL